MRRNCRNIGLAPAEANAAPPPFHAYCCCLAVGLSPTVMSGLSFRKLFSPMPLDVHRLLDLLAEDSRLNVYAGELEVRPPGAPTTTWVK